MPFRWYDLRDKTQRTKGEKNRLCVYGCRTEVPPFRYASNGSIELLIDADERPT